MKIPHCLNCNEELGGSTESRLRNIIPRPGSLSVCLYCGHLAIYADDMNLRELTGNEIVEVAGNEEVLRAQNITRQFRERFK